MSKTKKQKAKRKKKRKAAKREGRKKDIELNVKLREIRRAMEQKLYCEAPFDGLLNLCGEIEVKTEPLSDGNYTPPSVLDIKCEPITREGHESALEIVLDLYGPEG